MTPGFLPYISHVRPLLIIPYIINIAAVENEFMGAVVGGITGIIWGVWGTGYPLGFTAILLLIIGAATGLIISRLMGISVMAVIIVGLGAILAFEILDWFFIFQVWGYPGSSYAFFNNALPRWIYSSVFLPVFYFPVIKISERIDRIKY